MVPETFKEKNDNLLNLISEFRSKMKEANIRFDNSEQLLNNYLSSIVSWQYDYFSFIKNPND